MVWIVASVSAWIVACMLVTALVRAAAQADRRSAMAADRRATDRVVCPAAVPARAAWLPPNHR